MVSDNRTGLAIVNFSIMKHVYYKIRLPFCYLLVGIVAFNYASIIALVFGTNKDIFTSEVKAINKQWQTKPIVSIYISPRYLGERCAQGYEAVELNTTANSISGGSCSCEQSLVGSCSVGSSAVSEACLAMSISAEMKSKSWQGSTICIKRGGEAVLTRYLNWLSMPYYRKRPLTDLSGHCPAEYKKCGEGSNQQNYSTCFPVDEDCPITNLLVLPSNNLPPENEGWEAAGTFHHNNKTLFLRRQQYNELPVLDITFQLTERITRPNGSLSSVRSLCYVGTSRYTNYSIAAYDFKRWFNVTPPLPTCHIANQRFQLTDQVPLQDHFLQNLHLTEPACSGIDLYSLSDPRYQPALDPDYFNSGVKCDFTSKYTCVRDPYQRADCAPWDNICDGVVNQNICGASARAVRGAFSEDSNVTLGMYIEREVKWTDHCGIDRDVIRTINNPAYTMILFFGFVFWTSLYIGLSIKMKELQFFDEYLLHILLLACMLVQLLFIRHAVAMYNAVVNAECTYAASREIVQGMLLPAKRAEAHIYFIIKALVPMILEPALVSYITLRYYTLQNHRNDYFLVPITNTTAPAAPQISQAPVVPKKEVSKYTTTGVLRRSNRHYGH